MEEEIIGQLREVSGETIVRCDLCGLPRSAASVVVVDGRRGAAEPIESLRLCESCRRLMEADDLPLGVSSETETAIQDETS